ncbi:MAG: hypothetical protein HN348_08455 [Proteobacteria bacterium]|nr:hypothetical protein [Pseudomonadota bacterium]
MGVSLRFAPLLIPVVALGLGTSCAKKVDKFTVNAVVLRTGAKVGDVRKVCALGVALSPPLRALGSQKHPPRLAMVIAETTSALCAEEEAWEAELDSVRARHNLVDLAARSAEVKDARIREERAHARSADRWFRAFQQAEEAFGPMGVDCPRIKEDNEIVYLLALVAGVKALMHDKDGGSQLRVPTDVLMRVSRGSRCLDNKKWWNVPAAIEAATWAMIPGFGPEEIDAWAKLEEAAVAGEASGVRVARGLQVSIGANADLEEYVARGIRGHAASMEAVPTNPDWALLDEYARLVTSHESDLIWTEARGHRTEKLGSLPNDVIRQTPVFNPFDEADPFDSEDPFAEPEQPSEPE